MPKVSNCYLCGVKTLRTIVLTGLAAACLFCGNALRAQSLPNLGKASEITTGSLPNGISYYLVRNSDSPGFADFALVQPVRNDRTLTRENLVKLPHFYGRKPYDFLASKAVGYTSRGYIQHYQDATVFRFADVPVSQSDVCDSTLLMLFDIAAQSRYEQALVLSGNIDVPAVLERIRVLSMTISRRLSVEDTWQYGWRPQDNAVITTATSPVGAITLHYRSPRTERELMNTIQPVMSRLLAGELDIVLEHRLRAAFTEAKLPLADYRYRYVGSDETSSDELFSLAVFTAPDRLEEALKLVAGVLSSLDGKGATLEEVAFARSVIAEAAKRDDANYKMSNSDYLDKCIASYLYGANLASPSAISSIYSARKLDVGRERELLNRYISSTFSPNRNLHLRVTGPVRPDPDRVGELFAAGWSEGNASVSDIPEASDTLRLEVPRRKVKLKTTSADMFTGGKLWTFSNGIEVVFKQTKDKNAFHYGLMVKGGWTEIPGIKGTEPAFVQDVLSSGKVAGMSSSHLRDLLAMNGISLKPEISLSDVRFSGAAPSGSLQLVLKTMLAVANNYEPDRDAYLRYLGEKPVRLERDKFSQEGTRAVLDSIMCPSYIFAAGSKPQMPGDDLDVRVSQYVNQKSANMKNSVIVLIGDLDEASTLRLLTNMLGGFRSGQQRVVRPRLGYPLRDCWSTTYVQRNWRSNGVSVALGAKLPFGSESYAQMQLACAVLKAELDKALAADGMYCNVSGSADMLPAEMVTIYVNCAPVPLSGLPSDVRPVLPVQTLMTVRSVINRLANTELDASRLEFCKTMLLNRGEAGGDSSRHLRDAVLDRSSIGRDVRAGQAQRIKSISPEDLRQLFRALTVCDCEYVVQ